MICKCRLRLQVQAGKDRLLNLLEEAKPYLSSKSKEYKDYKKDIGKLIDGVRVGKCEGGEKPGAMYVLYGKVEHGKVSYGG